MYTRTIVEESPENIAIMDVFSKLIQERIIFIDAPIDDKLANGVIAQMLYLDSVDTTKPISIYINSPGGSVIQGLAIYDISQKLKSPIRTVSVGYSASMAAVLMLMGSERSGLNHSRIMFHEVSDWVYGKFSDIMIEMHETKIWQDKIYAIIKKKTKIQNPEEVFLKDTWYSAEEAVELNILTNIL